MARRTVDRENRVQSAITSVSFPQELERVRAMGKKWLKLIGTDWITDMDVLSDYPSGQIVPWIAPKWLTAGDILLFYHTKSALGRIRKLVTEAERIRVSGNWKTRSYLDSGADAERLLAMLRRSANAAATRSGTIFAYAVVGGRPVRIMDELKHFYGTIYAPIESVHVFERPLPSSAFSDLVSIGQNTTTPVYGPQFEGLQRRLAELNKLPESLAYAKPSGLGFREVNAGNWDKVACDLDTRFIDEEQLRTYFLDYLLDEIKDARSPVYRECNCVRTGKSSGRADYFVRLGNRLVPVEAKLNVLTEGNLAEQVSKYIHVDGFTPTKGRGKNSYVCADDTDICLIVDQAGLYLTKAGQFVGCAPNEPLYRREDLTRSKAHEVRTHLLTAMR